MFLYQGGEFFSVRSVVFSIEFMPFLIRLPLGGILCRAQHGGIGKPLLHFQGVQTFVHSCLVDSPHCSFRLIVVEHAGDGCGLGGGSEGEGKKEKLQQSFHILYAYL